MLLLLSMLDVVCRSSLYVIVTSFIQMSIYHAHSMPPPQPFILMFALQNRFLVFRVQLYVSLYNNFFLSFLLLLLFCQWIYGCFGWLDDNISSNLLLVRWLLFGAFVTYKQNSERKNSTQWYEMEQKMNRGENREEM